MKKFITLVAGLGLALLPVSAAEAHGFDIYHGNDWVHVGSGHENAWVHDKECDGNAVAAEVKYYSYSIKVKDANGCDSGGTQVGLGNNAQEIRICEDSSGWDCNAWHNI